MTERFTPRQFVDAIIADFKETRKAGTRPVLVNGIVVKGYFRGSEAAITS